MAFRRGFQSKTRTAIINLSHCFSYGSHWFLIFGLRRYCEPEQRILSVKPISREDSFTSCVFHELLHVWIDENIDKNSSPLLAKYREEDCHAREHLHLMAIQKMVYIKINRKDIVDVLDEGYRKFEWSPAYCRAWEIVNDIEGYETVLKDIEVSLIQQQNEIKL